MKQAYESKKFSPEHLEIIVRTTRILESFKIKMTVRQAYYQLVSADVIPNNVKSYKRIVGIIRDARMCGLLDWDWIEDRLREPRIPASWSSIQEIVSIATKQFCLDRWAEQPTYIEVWLEKDALAGIVGTVTQQWKVPLQVNRGYSSVVAMREAAHRFLRASDEGKECIIGYFGDHDPSGEDMVRDIRDRLSTFHADLTVKKLAILQDDIQEYNLPPQPVKDTDARAASFRMAHGDDCVELDALRPDVLSGRVQDFISDHLDMDLWNQVREEERRQRESVRVETD